MAASSPLIDREQTPVRPDVTAVIVGAGFGGLGAAIQLRRQGIDDFLILEREDDLGGTWHVNRYPGLAVDIASVTYSFSFEPNPYWSRVFAPGEEIKAYARDIADKYGLYERMRFATTVESASWDQEHGLWELTLASAPAIRTRYLITATGFLSQAKSPDIPGIDSFAGDVVHSADWDPSVALNGRRAAIIGTGATGVQLIPELASQVAELTVYQRTPIWVVPKLDGPVPKYVQKLFARVPAIQSAARLANTSILEAMTFSGVLHYRQFQLGNRVAELLGRAHLRAQVKDPETRRKLTPHYSLGCKRPTFSNSYFQAFNRPNVTLETESIDHIEPGAIVTTDGRRTQIDLLVLATGFSLWERNFPAIEITGRDGLNLGRFWREGRFHAYEGFSVPGFPNFLSLNSPYSYVGLSYFWGLEIQMTHMARLFSELERRGADQFEVKPEAAAAFLERMDRGLEDSVFRRGACAGSNSYYYDPHGEATLLRPASVLAGRRDARSFRLDDYDYRQSGMWYTPN
ncbi:MAG: NAD(P)/FAD-dependent oxidoreductase [Solirubrobacterales bacterium]|nr:NAD(P)/FAD-dependent oxidoreductase [Solirubrobacterales bacterium]